MTEIWVVDTSSIIEVKQKVLHSKQNVVFAELTKLVNQQLLVYPNQVVTELEYYNKNGSGPHDLPYTWAKKNKDIATRFPTDWEKVRFVLEHPLAKSVLDPDKTGVDEADPYVLALACQLQDDFEVTVLVEETKDRPNKLSMNTACGHLRIVTLNMAAFLKEKNIWP